MLRVAEPSVLRVSCRGVEHEIDQQMVTLKLKKAYLPVAVQNNSLYTQLNADQDYTLSIIRPENAIANAALIKSFELAVEPAAAMDNYIEAQSLVKCLPFSQHGGTLLFAFWLFLHTY